ncbi:Dinitrogenase reductase ADP-ribosyltransferase (DRAT) [Opitutaceae bacterium TAV1]|nr:Dinitrogenase reductase ADP-ribosyltransferase (DRAT) [Opitutaceae bacterium TAV5]EIQ02162.1 Dinitrogenase reductase ADP-ribosyltransferase (DRAT) [Opitutaceae bacterium TAV1]
MQPAPLPTLPSLFNHCNFSPWAISSWEFQDDPQPLELGHLRLTDRRLWERLDGIDDPAERGRVFHDYVSVKFRLHEWQEFSGPAQRCLRSSYLASLRNWGVDSNSPSGAALKAWVESRFGLRATWHHGRLATDPAARERYALDRMKGAAQTPSLFMQLDLLYTFCQAELARRHPGERWLTLYRGTHDPDEYTISAAPPREGRLLVELNNLSSFSSDREVAWEFGHFVWETAVPLSKIVFFSGLLPPPILQAESECLVLGGEYHVRRLRS